jgi:hypothetical protein
MDLRPDIAVANVNAFATDFLSLHRICHDDTSVVATLKTKLGLT